MENLSPKLIKSFKKKDNIEIMFKKSAEFLKNKLSIVKTESENKKFIKVKFKKTKTTSKLDDREEEEEPKKISLYNPIYVNFSYLDKEDIDQLDDITQIYHPIPKTVKVNRMETLFKNTFANFNYTYKNTSHLVDYFHAPYRATRTKYYLPYLYKCKKYFEILKLYQNPNSKYFLINKIDLYDEESNKKFTRRLSHDKYTLPNSIATKTIANGSFYYDANIVDDLTDEIHNSNDCSPNKKIIRKQTTLNTDDIIINRNRNNLKILNIKSVKLDSFKYSKKHTHENMSSNSSIPKSPKAEIDERKDSAEEYYSNICKVLLNPMYSKPDQHPNGPNYIIYTNIYSDETEEKQEVFLDKFYNINKVNLKGREKVQSEFKLVFRTLNFLRQSRNRMTWADLNRLIGNEKKLLQFHQIKYKLSKAGEVWMEILHEMKDNHRRILLKILIASNNNELSTTIYYGLREIRRDIISFIVYNYQWFENYPLQVKKRYKNKINMLHTNVLKMVEVPIKIRYFDNHYISGKFDPILFEQEQKLRHFRSNSRLSQVVKTNREPLSPSKLQHHGLGWKSKDYNEWFKSGTKFKDIDKKISSDDSEDPNGPYGVNLEELVPRKARRDVSIDQVYFPNMNKSKEMIDNFDEDLKKRTVMTSLRSRMINRTLISSKGANFESYLRKEEEEKNKKRKQYDRVTDKITRNPQFLKYSMIKQKYNKKTF